MIPPMSINSEPTIKPNIVGKAITEPAMINTEPAVAFSFSPPLRS